MAKLSKEGEKSQFTIDFLSDSNNYYLSNHQHLSLEKAGRLDLRDITLYKIKEITFENKSPRKEALENVFGSLNISGIHLIYLILGNEEGVSFYFGVAKDHCAIEESPFCVYDIGKHILEPSLKGNFRGSSISHVEKQEKETVLNSIRSMVNNSYLEGVAGINEEKDTFQGVDRLVDVMLGDKFSVMVIAKPVPKQQIFQIEKNLNQAYSLIAPFSKESIQDGTSWNKSENVSLGTNKSKTKGSNDSKSKQEGSSTSNSVADGTNTGKNDSTSKGTSAGTSEGTSSGSSSSGSNKGSNKGSNEGSSKGTTSGTSHNVTEGTGTSTSVSVSTGTTESVAEGTSETKGTNEGTGSSQSTTVEFIRKEVQDWLKYLDETIFPRLDYGKGKGMFITTTFLSSAQEGHLLKLENTMTSLYSGEVGNKVSLRAVPLAQEDEMLSQLRNFQIPHYKFKENLLQNEVYARSTLSQWVTDTTAFSGNWISAKELSLIAGLPQKEVVGLSLREEVEFGLNTVQLPEDCQKIKLGHIVQSGEMLKSVPVSLEKSVLNKHTFITGVTGSGKTTTCQRILMDSELPFLVIEPAKTEYRILTKNYDDLLIFTLGNDTVAPFRLNPFEFLPHESITSRVDMIKASLEANFDMEAAIPQLMETAIYDCYKDLGWNISNNRNHKFPDPFADGVYAFPTLSDMIAKVETVVTEQGFDERLKRDYIGSIKARLQGLTIGSKGLMLNCRRSIDFSDLLERKVVLEIEDVRSSAEKSLIIGFILTNLIESIKAKFLKDSTFQHITLIEEAHRLLSKFSAGDSQNKKQSVETFADMLAEVRKYGESLIIADQIPSKLAPEVLKNTNTKIVHKIFAADDKEAIGNTMALDDEQKNFLSNLEVGRAVLFTQGYTKAVQVEVERKTNTTDEEQISSETIRENVLKYYQTIYKKGLFSGLETFAETPTLEQFEAFFVITTEESFDKNLSQFLSTGKEDYQSLLAEQLSAWVTEFGEDTVKGIFNTYFVSLNPVSSEIHEEILSLTGELYDYIRLSVGNVTRKRAILGGYYQNSYRGKK